MVRRSLFPVTGGDLHTRAANRETMPRDPFSALQTEMMRFFDDLRRGVEAPAGMGVAPGIAAPQIDVQEDSDNLYVQAELPGLKENDVELTFNDGVLRIAGEKHSEQEQGDRQVHLTERAYGRFERQIPLNRAIDEEQIQAEFRNGVLTVTLPKAEEAQQGRRIEVQRAA